MSLLGRIYKKVLQEARASEGKIEQAIEEKTKEIKRKEQEAKLLAIQKRLRKLQSKTI